MAEQDQLPTCAEMTSRIIDTSSEVISAETESGLRMEDIKPPKRVIVRGLSPEERLKLRRKQNRESARRTRQRYRLQKRNTEKSYQDVVQRIRELEEQIHVMGPSASDRYGMCGKEGTSVEKEENGAKKFKLNNGMDSSSVIAVQNLINHNHGSDMSSSENSTSHDVKRKSRTNARGLSPEQKLELRRQQNRESARRLRERARVRKEALEKKHYENVAKVRHLEQVLKRLTQRKGQH